MSHGKAPFADFPFVLEPWQWFQVIGPIYGWKMPDGTRRFRSAFIFIPKKNGKTQLAAAISIRELFDQIGARCFMTAVSLDQMTIDGVFDEACGIVKRSEHLSGLIELLPSTNRMVIESRNAMLVALPTSAGSSQGKNASSLIFEEFHEWKDREFYNSLLYADSARVDSFACYITTAGDDLTSLCYEEYERACRIRDGKDMCIDHLVCIHEAKKNAKFDDLREWKRANPNYGVTLPERNIKRAIAQAAGSPQRIAALKRYRLNLWTKAKDGWIDPQSWDKCPAIRLPGDLSDVTFYGGLDLARVRDFAAFARVCKIDDVVHLMCRLWIPAARVGEKEQTDKIPLQDWIDRGFVHATPGDEIDYGVIRRDILAMNIETPLEEIGYDPYNAAHLCNQELSAQDGLFVCEVPQTMPHMATPSAEFERLLNSGKVRHEHNPALGWMVCNAITQRDNNENFRPIKGKSRGRIDGLIACLIAISRLSAPTNPNRRTFYDDQEPELV